MSAQKTDIMIVSPHPDDAEFGAAGAVARWVKEGKTAVYIICTNGDKGSDDYNVKAEELAKVRRKEQLKAARLLGVSEVIFLGFEDQGLEDASWFRKEIVRQIRTFRPDTLVTSNPYRRYIWHRDHRITGQVVLDAAFPCARDHLSYPDLFAGGLLPHRVKDILFWATDEPNYYVDITKTFDQKLQALSCHQSQVGGEKFAEVKKWVKERAFKAAKGQGFALAEAFYRAVFP